MTSYVKPVTLVAPGQRLRATTWNEMAGTVNRLAAARDLGSDVAAPRDVDGGVLVDEGPPGGAASYYETELSRTVSEVRITNPEDESQYVDVERIVTITFLRNDGVVITRRYRA